MRNNDSAATKPAQQKLVTVIIPVYNREEYIEQTIRSVLDQTYSNIELIVVDDGSTDNSKALIESFLPDLKLYTHPGGVNKGQSASINLAVKHISGEFVAILDSDDYWDPGKIKAQVDFLDQHPDLGLVYVNGDVVDETGKLLHPFNRPNHAYETTPEAYFLHAFFLFPSNSLMRTEAFRRAGPYDEKLRASPDYDIAVRVVENAKFGYLDKRLFSYRRHSQSISHVSALRMWENGFETLERAKQRYPYPPRLVRKRRAILHFRIGQCHLESRKFAKSAWHFLRSGLLDPVRAFGVVLGREYVSAPR